MEGVQPFLNWSNDSYVLRQRLVPQEPISQERFGQRVDLANGRIAISRNLVESGWYYTAAEIYKLSANEWMHEDVVQSDGAVRYNYPLADLVMGNDRLFLGIPGLAPLTPGVSEVIDFTRGGNGWRQNGISRGPIPNRYWDFGNSMAIGDGYIAISMADDYEKGTDAGAVQIYPLDGPALGDVDAERTLF